MVTFYSTELSIWCEVSPISTAMEASLSFKVNKYKPISLVMTDEQGVLENGQGKFAPIISCECGVCR